MIATTLSPSPALANADCAAAETLHPGSVLHRQYPTPTAEAELVRVPVDESGVLELYASGGFEDATLSILETGCPSQDGEAALWDLVRETPREIHLRIRERGELIIAVSSQAPDLPLSGYSLHATFAAERPVPDEVIAIVTDPPADCLADDPPTFSPELFAESRFVAVRLENLSKDVEPWDDDGISGFTTGSGVLVVESPDAALEISLHDGEGCTLEQRVAEGNLDGPGAFVAAPVHVGEKRLRLSPHTAFDAHYEAYVRYFDLCGDAVGTRPLCATVLAPGVEVAGQVDIETAERHLTFSLAGQETVAVDLEGEDGVRGVLYDDRGQRLETWGPGRLVRTLGRGRFYVLVASVDGWTGDFGLRMQTLP